MFIPIDKDTEVPKFHDNKTYLYLMPCITDYGPHFNQLLQKVYKLGWYVGDGNNNNPRILNERALFLLVDTEFRKNDYLTFIEFLKGHVSYIADYCPDENQELSRRRIIVFRLLPKYHKAHHFFIRGEYSKMYEPEDIERFIILSPDSKSVLYGKGYARKKKLIKKINSLFGTDFSHEAQFVRKFKELELPPEYKEEIFNNKVEDIKYFDISLQPINKQTDEDFIEILG